MPFKLLGGHIHIQNVKNIGGGADKESLSKFLIVPKNCLKKAIRLSFVLVNSLAMLFRAPFLS